MKTVSDFSSKAFCFLALLKQLTHPKKGLNPVQSPVRHVLSGFACATLAPANGGTNPIW